MSDVDALSDQQIEQAIEDASKQKAKASDRLNVLLTEKQRRLEVALDELRAKANS